MNGISVIIPNYNGATIIEDCLRALYKQKGVRFEIIVVDDCSTDDSVAMLQRLDKRGKIRLVQNRANQGYAGSCHAGTRVAAFSNYLFLNSDAYIQQQDALALMVEKFAADPDLGVLGCRQFNVDGTPQFYGSNVDLFLNINSVDRYFDLDETGTYDCMMTGGAAFAIRKSVYQQLDGIDTTYYLYVEELDLMWRARLLGYKVITFGDIRVVHLGGSSTGNAYNNTTNVKKMYFRERNALFTMLKNYQAASLVLIIPIYMIFQFGEISAMLLMRRTDAAKLYYRAWSDILKRRGELRAKRSAIQKLRKISDFRLYRGGYIRLTNYKVHQVITKGVPKIGA